MLKFVHTGRSALRCVAVPQHAACVNVRHRTAPQQNASDINEALAT